MKVYRIQKSFLGVSLLSAEELDGGLLCYKMGSKFPKGLVVTVTVFIRSSGVHSMFRQGRKKMRK